MALTALRGALGFLSRLPVGSDADAFRAFGRTPAAFPLAGYALGGLLALPLLAPAPGPVVALLFVAWAYLLTGITHLDGLADLGDAAVVHGDPADRRDAMKDTTVGVGAAVAVALVVVGLALAAVGLAALPLRAVALVVAAEVGAKAGMATVVCLGAAPHEGLGERFTSASGARSLPPVLLVALPAAALGWPGPAAAVAVVVAVAVALGTLGWARARLGGVSGDVLGAANELGRLAALHAGVIAWTPS